MAVTTTGDISTAAIRNVALLGHTGSGKTTLAEQMLFAAGAITRAGSIADGNTLLDYDELSREHKHTLETGCCHVRFEDRLINILDTPGYPELAGPAIAALEAVETAIVVVNAHNGIETGTRRLFAQAREQQLGIVFVVNKMDTDYTMLSSVLESLQETFGPEVLPLNLPANAGNRVIDCYNSERGQTDIGDVHRAHVDLLEAAIESDESLLERYLADGKVNAEELERAMDKAIVAEHVIPVLFTNARSGVGVRELLEVIAHFCPNPQQGRHRTISYGNGPTARRVELDPETGAGHFIGQVVRIGSDPKSNIRHTVFRVFTGELRGDQQFYVNDMSRPMKAAHLFRLQGAGHEPIDRAVAGDIVALPRLELRLGDVLHDTSEEVHIDMPHFPSPMYAQAVEPRSRSDEAKLIEALQSLAMRDPCLVIERDEETHETVVRGLGDLHLRLTLERMSRQYHVEVNTHPPRIPYRETIQLAAEGHHRHRKQSGGAGQFGEVYLRIAPIGRDDEQWPMGWSWDIFGGVISRSFEPAVRKGCEDEMAAGPLAGYPVEGIAISIYDGKEHPVDSKEVAFRSAGRYALRDALLKAHPVLLEPMMEVEITVPDASVGAVTGEITTRRGRPTGQENLPGGRTSLRAVVPLAEMANYAGVLSGMTGGQGDYQMHFSSYEPAPPHVTEKLAKLHATRSGGNGQG